MKAKKESEYIHNPYIIQPPKAKFNLKSVRDFIPLPYNPVFRPARMQYRQTRYTVARRQEPLCFPVAQQNIGEAVQVIVPYPLNIHELYWQDWDYYENEKVCIIANLKQHGALCKRNYLLCLH